MEFGLNLRNFMADPNRPMHDQIEETSELLSLGEGLGSGVPTPPSIGSPTRPGGSPPCLCWGGSLPPGPRSD